jgi:toxin secretion/phage lysis holin
MWDFWDTFSAWMVRAAAAVGGFFVGLYGGWDNVMTTLVYAMVMDYITGIIVALMGRSHKTKHGYLDSRVGFRGLLKKVLIMAAVGVGVMVDQAVGSDTATFRTAVALFFFANEALSIIENLGRAGVRPPHKLQKFLEQLKEEGDNDSSHDTKGGIS